MRLVAVAAALLVGCSGHSTILDAEPCPVVLANPGPAAGCMRVVAGEGTTVRLVGDDGSGEADINVHAGNAYEALSCRHAADTGAPTIGVCSE